jgi:hypothetical protein
MVRSHPWVYAVALVGLALTTSTADAAAKNKKKPSSSEPAAAPAAKDDPAPAGPEFDRQAAVTAITDVNLQKCKATNAQKGEGHVTITFLPGGAAQHALVDKGPWVGTPVAKCMAKAFKKAKVPAFKGDAVTVGKTFHFE